MDEPKTTRTYKKRQELPIEIDKVREYACEGLSQQEVAARFNMSYCNFKRRMNSDNGQELRDAYYHGVEEWRQLLVKDALAAIHSIVKDKKHKSQYNAARFVLESLSDPFQPAKNKDKPAENNPRINAAAARQFIALNKGK